jgi:hypothetical protein
MLPCGLHMIYLSFANAFRHPDMPFTAHIQASHSPLPFKPKIGLTKLPCGLHMIYLPFANVLRHPELPPPLAPSALTDAQMGAARDLVSPLPH